MKITNLTFAIISSILVASCSPDKSEKSAASAQSATPSASTMIVYSNAIYPLGQVIHLPVEPESVKFQTINLAVKAAGAAEEWGIVALMKFSDENMKVVLENSRPIDDKNLPVAFGFDWLKPDVDANFKKDAAGNNYEFNKSALSAEYFYRSPLIQGASYQVSPNELLVYIHTAQ